LKFGSGLLFLLFLNYKEEHTHPFIHSPIYIYRKKQNPWCMTTDLPPPIVFVNIQKRCVETRAFSPLDAGDGSLLQSFSCDGFELLNNASSNVESWCYAANEIQDDDDRRIDQSSESGPHLLSWEENNLS
jgi:hypothetical protein